MSLTFPHEGLLSRQTAPLVKSGTDALKSVANVLGSTQRNFTFSAADVRAVETLTLERLAENKHDYTGFTISSAMMSSNAAIFELMPMERSEAITFTHDYYNFPKELAIATPAQAPPSYVEVEKRSTSVTLERYALGATTTVQELRTAEGQFVFRGKLIVVAVGFIEVAELLAIELLLSTPSLYAQYYIEAGQHPIDLQRTGRMSDLYFDILRRRDNGMGELIDMVRTSMSVQNIMPTHLIIPEGLRSLMIASPKWQEYNRIGAEAADNSRRLTDAVGENWDGIRFIIIAAVELPKKDIRIAPLERHAIIGQHFRLDHFHEDCDYEKYCSKFMSIQVFSMETNTWATLGIEDAVNADWRFSRADGRLSDWHYTLVEDLENKANKVGVPVYQQQYDMFVYLLRNDDGDVVANVAELWGHMEKWALGEQAVDRVAQTTAASARKEVLEQTQIGAITQGLEDIRELYERTLDNTDLAFLKSEGEIGRYGVRRLPRADDSGVVPRNGSNYYPAGYGSVEGYLEIASTAGQPGYEYVDQGLAERAMAFRKAAIALHKFYLSVYGPTHPVLNPNNAPVAYRSAVAEAGEPTAATINTASLLSFLHNVVDTPKSKLFIANAGARSGIEIIQLPDDSPYITLNDIFADVGAPPEVAEVFGSPERLAAFEREYADSTFRSRYDAYLADLRQATQRRTRRGAPSVAGGLSTDVDQPEQFGVTDDEQGGKTALARFHEREVEQGRLSNEEALALYARLIDSVRKKRAPTRIDADTLRAWANDPSKVQRETIEREVPQGARRTAFVASLDALRNSSVDIRGDDARQPGLAIESPQNPGRAIDIRNAGAELDGAGANIDLLTTTLTQANGRTPAFSVATLEAGVPPEPGVRGPPPRFRSAADDASVFGGGGVIPPFASQAFTDVVGAQIVVNKNIRERFAALGIDPNWQTRVAGQMFILAPITKQVLLAFKRKNIAVPVAWLVQQFNRRYRTQSIIFVSKSSIREFGSIRYMDFDTHIGRNAVNKNLMVHVSGYMGATAEDVQDWFVAHDIAVVGYEGGENTVPFTAETWNINQLDKLPVDGPSLLYFMVPADSLVGKHDGKAPTPHDIRGYSDPVHHRGTSVHRASQFAERPHYKSALYYVTLLQLNRMVTPTSEDWHRFHRREGTLNTVTHQGLQRVINPHTLNHELVIFPTDPFKDAVYPGARELRDSQLPRTYKSMNYEEVAISY